jgi:hypothetical protein
MQIDLSSIFTDTRFRELSRYRLYGEIDGVRVGIALATRTPRYDNFALNKGDLERLLTGVREGRIDRAFVVQASVNGLNAMTFVASIEAAELEKMLNGVRPLTGRFGEFFVLPAQFKVMADEPF